MDISAIKRFKLCIHPPIISPYLCLYCLGLQGTARACLAEARDHNLDRLQVSNSSKHPCHWTVEVFSVFSNPVLSPVCPKFLIKPVCLLYVSAWAESLNIDVMRSTHLLPGRGVIKLRFNTCKWYLNISHLRAIQGLHMHVWGVWEETRKLRRRWEDMQTAHRKTLGPIRIQPGNLFAVRRQHYSSSHRLIIHSPRSFVHCFCLWRWVKS